MFSFTRIDHNQQRWNHGKKGWNHGKKGWNHGKKGWNHGKKGCIHLAASHYAGEALLLGLPLALVLSLQRHGVQPRVPMQGRTVLRPQRLQLPYRQRLGALSLVKPFIHWSVIGQDFHPSHPLAMASIQAIGQGRVRQRANIGNIRDPLPVTPEP
jgi:hypothetical protein